MSLIWKGTPTINPIMKRQSVVTMSLGGVGDIESSTKSITTFDSFFSCQT